MLLINNHFTMFIKVNMFWLLLVLYAGAAAGAAAGGAVVAAVVAIVLCHKYNVISKL